MARHLRGMEMALVPVVRGDSMPVAFLVPYLNRDRDRDRDRDWPTRRRGPP